MKKGSKETGSNCDKVKTSIEKKKKKDTVRQTKKTIKNEKGTMKRGGQVISSSTTNSSDTNKSTDICGSRRSPDCDNPSSQSSTNPQLKTPEISKEDASNQKKSLEKAKSRVKSFQKSVPKSEKDEVKLNEKEKIVAKSQPKSEKDSERREEKEEKKFNMHLAQLFFKRMMDAQRTSHDNNSKQRDENLDVMPTSLYQPKTKKKHRPRTRRTRKLDTRIFKENGEPVWVYPILKEEKMGSNGVKNRVPELADALEEDGLDMEDGKQWGGMMEDFMSNKLDDGIIKESIDELNPYDTLENLEERSEIFFRDNSKVYYTVANLLLLAQDAIRRFEEREQRTNMHRLKEMEQKKLSKEEGEEKTCVMTSIKFNMDSTFSISYDRRHPVQSIKKFRQKYQERLRQAVLKGRKISRETVSRKGSKERTSKEKS